MFPGLKDPAPWAGGPTTAGEGAPGGDLPAPVTLQVRLEETVDSGRGGGETKALATGAEAGYSTGRKCSAVRLRRGALPWLGLLGNSP